MLWVNLPVVGVTRLERNMFVMGVKIPWQVTQNLMQPCVYFLKGYIPSPLNAGVTDGKGSSDTL